MTVETFECSEQYKWLCVYMKTIACFFLVSSKRLFRISSGVYIVHFDNFKSRPQGVNGKPLKNSPSFFSPNIPPPHHSILHNMYQKGRKCDTTVTWVPSGECEASGLPRGYRSGCPRPCVVSDLVSHHGFPQIYVNKRKIGKAKRHAKKRPQFIFTFIVVWHWPILYEVKKYIWPLLGKRFRSLYHPWQCRGSEKIDPDSTQRKKSHKMFEN